MVKRTRSRPGMPGYGITDDETGMLAWAWVSEQMRKARNYWVCTTRPDGRPHAVPVWGVWLGESLYFSTGKTSRKTKNIKQNPNVAIHLESGDEVVIFEGVLEQVTDAALLAHIPEPYHEKYGFRPDLTDVDGDPTYVLRPKVALAWLEADYPTTATKWTFAR